MHILLIAETFGTAHSWKILRNPTGYITSTCFRYVGMSPQKYPKKSNLKEQCFATLVLSWKTFSCKGNRVYYQRSKCDL